MNNLSINDKMLAMSTQESEKILYSNVTTKELVESEPSEVPVIDFRKSDIVGLYELPPDGLGISGTKIAVITGYTDRYIYTKLKKAGAKIRPTIQNPLNEQRRLEGIRSYYSKPNPELMARLH